MRQLNPGTKFSLALGLLSLLAATGCGNGGGVVLQNPMGNFSNASLKGSYAYEIHGAALATGELYREAGVFTSDGSGHITAAVDDFAGHLDNGSQTTTTGTYSIAKDGTGSISLGPTVLGQITGVNTITFAITLVSSSKLQLIEADNFANAAGVAELQSSTAAPSGTFAFHIHQAFSAQGQGPAGQVGAFTVGSGVNGMMDQNLSGASTNPNITWTFGAPGSMGQGTGNFIDSNTNFQTNFDYFIVSSSKVYLLMNDSGAVGAGVAELQSGGVNGGLSGNYAFGGRGDDNNFFDGVATVGQFGASGGNLSGQFDESVDGTLATGNIASCFNAASTAGRVVVTDCGGNTLQVFWMVNPSRAFFVDSSASKTEDGSADAQSTNAFSTSTLNGQFTLVMDGVDLTLSQLLSRVGTLQFNGSNKITLNEVANASSSGNGAQSPGLLAGPYAVSANGRMTGTVSNNGGNALDFVMYAVSGSSAYTLQNDSGLITSGTVGLQQ